MRRALAERRHAPATMGSDAKNVATAGRSSRSTTRPRVLRFDTPSTDRQRRRSICSRSVDEHAAQDRAPSAGAAREACGSSSISTDEMMFASDHATGATSGSSVAASPSMTARDRRRRCARRSPRRSRSRRDRSRSAATRAAPSFAAAIASTALPRRGPRRDRRPNHASAQRDDAARRRVLAGAERHRRAR